MNTLPSVTEHDYKPIKKQGTLTLRLTIFEDDTPVIHNEQTNIVSELSGGDILYLLSNYLRLWAKEAALNDTRNARSILREIVGTVADMACYASFDYEHQEAK